MTPMATAAAADRLLSRFMPGKRSFFNSSMAAIISIDTMKTMERGLKPRLSPYQIPPAATTNEVPYLMIFCQV